MHVCLCVSLSAPGLKLAYAHTHTLIASLSSHSLILCWTVTYDQWEVQFLLVRIAWEDTTAHHLSLVEGRLWVSDLHCAQLWPWHPPLHTQTHPSQSASADNCPNKVHTQVCANTNTCMFKWPHTHMCTYAMQPSFSFYLFTPPPDTHEHVNTHTCLNDHRHTCAYINPTCIHTPHTHTRAHKHLHIHTQLCSNDHTHMCTRAVYHPSCSNPHQHPPQHIHSHPLHTHTRLHIKHTSTSKQFTLTLLQKATATPFSLTAMINPSSCMPGSSPAREVGMTRLVLSKDFFLLRYTFFSGTSTFRTWRDSRSLKWKTGCHQAFS